MTANPPRPVNEPIRDYAPGSTERLNLEQALKAMSSESCEIAPVIGGRRVMTGKTQPVVMPHDHRRTLAVAHLGGEKEAAAAIAAAEAAWPMWNTTPWEERVAIFLRAADLLAGPWRDRLNAATMLGQSKTCIQAEIDAACELIDFWRFNSFDLTRLYAEQPFSPRGVWNRMEYRALEGFIFAVTPFNFTSIGGNLPTAPALLGNTVIWKPATTQLLSAWYTLELLHEAGLPPGVINFLPGSGPDIGHPVLASPALAGIHFTGSTTTFQHLWRTVGENITAYRSYPRLVGETGGKDFVFAHPSADPAPLVTALLRGAFEYQGQKCSAASRAFIPESLWDRTIEPLIAEVNRIPMGNPADFSQFIGAVIDEAAFHRIAEYIEYARHHSDYRILAGGGADREVGYFIEPTVIAANDPAGRLMREEIFGPVLTVYRYPDRALDETLEVLDRASPYALTGAIFARDRRAIAEITARLRYTAGNFYINDKPTGAVVGQQPFGGGRASGTNDKAGSIWNLIRWTSPRTIKETFTPPCDWRYPHMG